MSTEVDTDVEEVTPPEELPLDEPLLELGDEPEDELPLEEPLELLDEELLPDEDELLLPELLDDPLELEPLELLDEPPDEDDELEEELDAPPRGSLVDTHVLPLHDHQPPAKFC